MGSVILAAVLLKLGTYGFVRVALPILPEAAVEWAPWIGLLAVIGIIYGALGCLAQTDMKRLIAFSSVAHMGFVMLGIATPHRLRPQRRGVRHGRPRPHHRHALLPRRLGEGAVPHARDQAPRRPARSRRRRWAGSSASARWRRSACPAWPGSGVSSRRSSPPTTPAPGLPEETFRTYMVIAAVGTVFAAGYLLWLFQRTSFGTPTEEFADEDVHDVHVTEWIAWLPMLVPILVLGVFPNLIFQVTDPRAHRRWARPSRRWASSACSRPSSSRRSTARTSTSTRSRRRSSSPARSCVVLRGRPLHAVGLAGHRAAARRHRAPRRDGAGAHARRRRRRPRRCSAAPTSSTTSRSCSRRCSCVGGYVVVLLSTNYIAEGDYYGGRVLLPAAVVARSA